MSNLVFSRGCSSKIYLKNQTGIILLGCKKFGYHWYRSFEFTSLVNSGLLVYFRLIFHQEVYFRLCRFYCLVFFRVVF